MWCENKFKYETEGEEVIGLGLGGINGRRAVSGSRNRGEKNNTLRRGEKIKKRFRM